MIPAYNRPALVRRALRSVASQRPRPAAEVIVVDDGSTDETAAAAEAMGAWVIRHETNLGKSMARNTGVDAAGQPWIALLDSDDEWLPHHLDTLWKLRGAHVLVADSCVTRGEGPGAGRFQGPITRRPIVLGSPAPLVYPHNFMPNSAVMVRRSVLLEVGGYRPELPHAEDLDALLRVLERGTGVASPSIGVLYHLHSGQSSSVKREMWSAHLSVTRAYAGRDWCPDALVQRALAVSLWDEFRSERDDRPRREALSCLRRLGRRDRLVGLAGILLWRYLVRRRSARLASTTALATALAPPPEGQSSTAFGSPLAELLARAIGAAPIGRARQSGEGAVVPNTNLMAQALAGAGRRRQ